jgi:hypothetical protein
MSATTMMSTRIGASMESSRLPMLDSQIVMLIIVFDLTQSG